jgi:hypothetical protein
MAKQEMKDTHKSEAPKTVAATPVTHPIVAAYLALREALQVAMADAKAGEHDNTTTSGQALAALLAAGGRWTQIEGHNFRHLFIPRGVSLEASDPECSRLAGDVATFLGGCMTWGAKVIPEGDVNLPYQQRVAGVLSKSKVWADAAPVLDGLVQGDDVKRKADEETAHWARLGAAKEAAAKAKAAGPKVPPPGPSPLPPPEVIPVS